MIKRKRLIWQLYPAYLVLVLVTLLATGWYASRAMRAFYISQIRQELIYHARFLAPQILTFLEPLNSPALDRFSKQTVMNIPIRLTIVLPDGTVAADSETDPLKMENHGDRPEIRQAFKGDVGTDQRFSDTLGQQMMYLAWPLRTDPVPGVLRVSIALTAIEQSLRALQWRLFLGAMVIAGLAALVCLMISRRISRPLEIMRLSAARFAKGDLAHRLAAPATEELAALAQAMNQMAQELEQRMAAIVQQRNESEAVFSSMAEGVVALDQDERILRVNAAARSLFNGESGQLEGRSIQELVRNRELHEMVRTTLIQGITARADIAIHRTREHILNIHCTPLANSAGQRMGALLVVNDVTQLRRLETMRSDFAANVSHEIKTPLTAIQGFVETLVQGMVTDPQEAQRFLQIISKHVRRLSAIVDDLMQLARLEQGDREQPLKPESASIHQLLQAAIQVCRPAGEQKGIAIHLACPQELTAHMDTALMEQAAVNLLDNAIKYSPENSHIQVTVQVAEQIRIDVRDEGIGIAQKHLPRLFERFYRVDENRSRRLGGTGLGLAIVKHIVQVHGGRVTVESVEGQGSTFSIHLPRSL
ncbi:MAG: HAMP domain-containing histidine kinase [Desulfobacteraceae bacterium]|nr:MAG: HAMP domain-containing histidine kinase [Desulfobacteraceae bacterium]